MTYNPGNDNYTLVQGVQVENDALKIAEKIAEINPNLRLQFLAENAAMGEAPFQVVETGTDGRDYVAFYAWELDDRLIQRIYASDNAKIDVLTGIEQNNNKIRRYVENHYKDLQQDATEKLAYALTSHKDTYVIDDEYTNKRVKIKSNEPPEVTDLG